MRYLNRLSQLSQSRLPLSSTIAVALLVLLQSCGTSRSYELPRAPCTTTTLQNIDDDVDRDNVQSEMKHYYNALDEFESIVTRWVGEIAMHRDLSLDPTTRSLWTIGRPGDQYIQLRSLLGELQLDQYHTLPVISAVEVSSPLLASGIWCQDSKNYPIVINEINQDKGEVALQESDLKRQKDFKKALFEMLCVVGYDNRYPVPWELQSWVKSTMSMLRARLEWSTLDPTRVNAVLQSRTELQDLGRTPLQQRLYMIISKEIARNLSNTIRHILCKIENDVDLTTAELQSIEQLTQQLPISWMSTEQLLQSVREVADYIRKVYEYEHVMDGIAKGWVIGGYNFVPTVPIPPLALQTFTEILDTWEDTWEDPLNEAQIIARFIQATQHLLPIRAQCSTDAAQAQQESIQLSQPLLEALNPTSHIKKIRMGAISTSDLISSIEWDWNNQCPIPVSISFHSLSTWSNTVTDNLGMNWLPLWKLLDKQWVDQINQEAARLYTDLLTRLSQQSSTWGQILVTIFAWDEWKAIAKWTAN